MLSDGTKARCESQGGHGTDPAACGAALSLSTAALAGRQHPPPSPAEASPAMSWGLGGHWLAGAVPGFRKEQPWAKL